MPHKYKLIRFATALAASLIALPASASFLDSDFWCRTYGCAVVHDGQNFDIYDNYIFAQGRCCVAPGTKMIPYSNSFGQFNLTGSLNKHLGPNSNQGMMFGITQNGATVSQHILDNGDGYLDAADSFSTGFSINSMTDIRLDGPGKAYSHSFFITSRNTRFSLRALASIANSSGDFSNTLSLKDIKLNASYSRRGNDGGFRYGRRARTSNITVLSDVNNLGDLQASSKRVFRFDRIRGIRRRNGNLNDQTIRLDFLYTMPNYDLSMGTGSLNVDLVFDLYKEP